MTERQPRLSSEGVTASDRGPAGAYSAGPERFVRKPPEPPRLPAAAWINCPTQVVA